MIPLPKHKMTADAILGEAEIHRPEITPGAPTTSVRETAHSRGRA
jgi:hypothetical protein